MIIEIDTNILNKIKNLNMNQLVFLSLVSNDNQNSYQDIHKLFSLIDDNNIRELLYRGLIVSKELEGKTLYKTTETYNNLIGNDKDFFDEFYEAFPVYVVRPDGSKGFLRANVNKCRREYKQIVGHSIGMHEHIMKCLNAEINEKMETGKLGYLKTMWKWLVNKEWETTEEKLKFEQTNVTPKVYGTELQ